MDDFNRIINTRLFDYWLVEITVVCFFLLLIPKIFQIKHAPLLRQNQSYILLPNGLQYTRQWMTKILGSEIVDAIFDLAEQMNQLNLTSEEYALIFPVIICFEGTKKNRALKLFPPLPLSKDTSFP